MDNRDRLELRRRRMAESAPLLRGGFRPFFFGAAAWAIVAIGLWMWAFEVGVPMLGALDPLAWHKHEMLFGFVGAAVSGFALTAVPNWTGRLPIAGGPLAILAFWWLSARLLPFILPGMPVPVIAILDGGFYIALALLIVREIIQAKNRNVPIAAIIALFGLANITDYAGILGMVEYGLGFDAGLALVTALLSLIGGRIVPSFTRNWMQKEQIGGRFPTQADRFDLLAIGVTAIALFSWIVTDPNFATGLALIFASVLQLLRLFRWRGWRTLGSPIVFILHLSYLWIPLGLFLLGLASLEPAVVRSAGIHALTVGAMASMILAVMTRATLGHTGRALRANSFAIGCYLTIQLAALARVFATLTPEHYLQLIHAAGALWIMAFALFLINFGPILFRPRLSEAE